ncbi:ABC transporter ATP-binding protein [Kineococcus rhizosphaerae]|uniref:Peptide/nickel transport system ATP-binding protein n=1 Tax=Kineococcus rhizosphaerae TaxID=559628 RepID=A0A2T0QYA3_9ACTN|nr:ABC transporter ATP-binding protein [Kineococcus rhizosphaerae]PRY11185.1 peptide/nickel transport system ATP-binding protein [Kineococcus rhizosphaerae]
MSPVVPQQSSAHPLLRVRGLDVRYRSGDGADHLAVAGASFDLQAGQRMALVGQSGSGKTTLALAVTGLLTSTGTTDVRISADQLTFEGRPVVSRGRGAIPLRTPGIAVVFQDAMNALDPVRPVGKQLAAVLAGAGTTGRAARDAAGHWLERVGLRDVTRVLRSRPDELSGGMRQRVMIAIALAGGPRLLVADEPTSALDASLARGAMELLTELTRSEGVALLVISHDILLCLEHTDVVGVMYDGEIVEFGDSARLAEHAEHPYTRALVECVPTLADRTRQWLPTLADVMSTS